MPSRFRIRQWNSLAQSLFHRNSRPRLRGSARVRHRREWGVGGRASDTSPPFCLFRSILPSLWLFHVLPDTKQSRGPQCLSVPLHSFRMSQSQIVLCTVWRHTARRKLAWIFVGVALANTPASEYTPFSPVSPAKSPTSHYCC